MKTVGHNFFPVKQIQSKNNLEGYKEEKSVIDTIKLANDMEEWDVKLLEKYNDKFTKNKDLK